MPPQSHCCALLCCPATSAGAGLREALRNVSFKRELVLVPVAGRAHTELALHLHLKLRRMGMSHFLALSHNVSNGTSLGGRLH